MPIVVTDLDGTLNNCVHRQHLAAQGRWEEFHSLLGQDTIYDDVAWMLLSLPTDLTVMAVTGRNERYRKETYHWLERATMSEYIDSVLMRPDDNFESDHILKPRMLEENLGSKQKVLEEVVLVLDDRDKVVQAWRDYGLPCWQVRPGGY